MLYFQLSTIPFSDDKTKHKDQNTDDNPFSFKRFLNRTTNKPLSNSYTGDKNNSYSPAYQPPYQTNKLPHHFTPFDLATNLPDFVQDHYPNDNGINVVDSPRVRPQSDMPLPDFALDTDAATHNNYNETGARPKYTLPDHPVLPPVVADSSEPVGLPDFLSDNNQIYVDSSHVSDEGFDGINLQVRIDERSYL